MFENIKNIKGKIVDKINGKNEVSKCFLGNWNCELLEQTKNTIILIYIMEIVKAYKRL